MRVLVKLAVVGAIVIASSSASVLAETVYLASSFETLYRVTPEREIESFQFDVKLRGMHRHLSTGTIFVLADPGGDADETVYTLENGAAGTPALIYYAQLTRHYGSLVAIGDTFYSFSYGNLYAIDLSDPANPIEAYVGSTGVSQSAGAAYDPVGNTLYMLSYTTDALYKIDPATAEATYAGSLGINGREFGAAWYDDQMFVAAQNGTTGAFEIGTVDTNTGAYSTLYTIANGAYEVATALTIVPGLTLPLDIKPGSCPNSFNTNSQGRLPVALLGTEGLDVMDVDLDSVQLARADGIGGAVWPLKGPPGPHSVIDDVGTPFDGELCDCHELGGDGIPDLVMKFDNAELVDALELMVWDPSEPLELILSGSLLDGTSFEARDCIQLR